MAMPTLTTYGGLEFEAGYAGNLVSATDHTIESKVLEGALSVDFGVAVARGATNGTCKAPTVDGDQIIGISVRHATMAALPGNIVLYAPTAAVPVLKFGFIYAVATEATAQGDGVISRTATNGALGSTTGGAAGVGRVAVPGAKWEDAVAIGAIGRIRIVS